MSDPAAHLPIVLAGLPGAGKSSAGRQLARRLGVPHLDTDQLIEEAAQLTVPEIFAREGEDGFRARELAAIRDAVSQNAVVSLGGGALQSRAARDLLRTATLVQIDADHDVLLERVARKNHRPLLREDPEGTLRRLADERLPVYRQMRSFVVESTSAPVSAVVGQILRRLQETARVQVVAEPAYPVLIGAGVAQQAVRALPSDAQKVLLVTPAELTDYAADLAAAVQESGREVVLFTHPSGEAAKSLAVAQQAWDLAGESRLGRRDAVLTLGGGATTDLGGFIAATWLRGVRVVHAPTTLLAMVDAAVGGKTGINSAAGKNLIGAFYNPQAVVADLDYLCTLPEREYRAGLGEVVKAGFVSDPRILELIESHPQVAERDWAVGEGRAVLQELIERAVRFKAQVVAADFREGGLREILNYGHTLAHAIEKVSDYQVLHGEAVAIGSVFAAQLAESLGMLDSAAVRRHRELFAAAGLPIRTDLGSDQLVPVMFSDKKTRGDQLRFVLLEGDQAPQTREVDAQQVRRVLDDFVGRDSA